MSTNKKGSTTAPSSAAAAASRGASDRSSWLYEAQRHKPTVSHEYTNSVSRTNNSWYRSEFAHETNDRCLPVVFSPSAVRNEISTSSSLKRLKLSDSYSLSRHAAKTSERYLYQDSCGDGVRRDTPSLRFFAWRQPEVVHRLPCSKNTTSPWLANSVASSARLEPVLPLSFAATQPSAPTVSRRQPSRTFATRTFAE